MKPTNIWGKLPQLIVLLAIVVAVGIRTTQNYNKKIVTALSDNDLLSNLKQINPSIENIEKEADEVYLIADKNNDIVGKAIIANRTTGKIIGYSGPTPTAIIVNNDDKIEGIGLLPNDETPSYVEHVTETGFFKKWNGMQTKDAANLDMDGVSGATYTSEAVSQTVKQRLAEYNNSIASARKIDIKKIAGYASIIFVLIYALAFYFYPQRFNKYRISLLIASIIILGFAFGSFLSIKLITGWLLQGVSFSNQIIFITIATLALILPFIFGKNYYCTFVCPFGASQELLGKLCKKKVELPHPVTAILTRTRSKILLLVIVIAVFGSTIEISDAEPFSAFLFASASKGVIVLAVLFLLISALIPRAWCRFFCPTGALLNFLCKQSKDVFPANVKIKTQLWALLVAVIFLLAVFGKSILSLI